MEFDEISPETTDETLLLAMAQGIPEAITVFVRRFQRRVYGLALMIAIDEPLAEEIAQESLLKIWRHAAMYDPRRGSVTSWVLTITRHVAIDRVRVRTLPRVDPEALYRDELQSDNRSPEEEVVVGDSVEFLRYALEQLPPEQRRALILASFYGRTANEIAVDESIPLGTAKTRIRSGLRNLRKQFTAEGYLNP